MKRIGIVTATRAEYGLLSPLIKELRKYENDVLAIDLIVTGTHLSYDYGHTIEEIDDRIYNRNCLSRPMNKNPVFSRVLEVVGSGKKR